jgi:voltage-gated potassium channel
MTTPAGRYFKFLVRKPLTPARAGRAIAASTFLVTIACGIVMRVVDSSEFGSFWLGLWWAVQTVTTVGYGDIVPNQTSGRVVAAVLMLTGIGFLTVVTAVITAAFLEPARRRLAEPGHAEVIEKLDELSSRLAALEQRR